MFFQLWFTSTNPCVRLHPVQPRPLLPICPIDFTSNSICWKASDHWRNNYEIWGTNLDMRIVRCYETTISLHDMFASIYDQSSSLQSPLVRLNHLKPGRSITHDTDTSKNISLHRWIVMDIDTQPDRQIRDTYVGNQLRTCCRVPTLRHHVPPRKHYLESNLQILHRYQGTKGEGIEKITASSVKS